jgi:hypothetical protein
VGRWHEQSVTGGRLQVIEALCRMAKLVVALAWLKENGRRSVIVERSKRKNMVVRRLVWPCWLASWLEVGRPAER